MRAQTIRPLPYMIAFMACLMRIDSTSGAELPQQAMTFDAMDVFELEWASDPRVSPDGQSIVYVRRSFEIMR